MLHEQLVLFLRKEFFVRGIQVHPCYMESDDIGSEDPDIEIHHNGGCRLLPIHIQLTLDGCGSVGIYDYDDQGHVKAIRHIGEYPLAQVGRITKIVVDYVEHFLQTNSITVH